MKKYIVAGAILYALACNNNPGNISDPVEKADSINEAQQEVVADAARTKEASSDFLVKAADGGMAEVSAGKVGEAKAVSATVKEFAGEMTKDHEAINKTVKSLASKLDVILPSMPGEDHQKELAGLEAKRVKDFDMGFMDMMVSDHKKTIDLFRDAGNKPLDPDVKEFIITTLPVLESHLAKAEAIRKAIK